MTTPRSRLVAFAAALVSASALALACRSSTSTPAPTGPGQTPRGQLVDTFALNVVSDSAWTIRVGVVATYYLALNRVSATGWLGGNRLAPHVSPRLLTDTITIEDTLHGPPIGTHLVKPSYMTYGPDGTLWMSVTGDSSIIQYTRAQTSQNGSLNPSVTLTGCRTPLGLAFDGQGNLWVIDSATTSLREYSGITLATGGRPTDTISLAGITTGGATWSPISVAVDDSNDVWVSAQPRTLPTGPAADSVPSHIVVEFSAADIQARGTPGPARTIVQVGTHVPGYGPGMTFDSHGNLWTANGDASTLTQFTAASLTAASNPSPAVTITGTILGGAADIAIDRSGLTFVGGSEFNSPTGVIAIYAGSSLTTSGSPAPDLVYSGPSGLSHFAVK
jgi:sugar lactone lactonase YvrE